MAARRSKHKSPLLPEQPDTTGTATGSSASASSSDSESLNDARTSTEQAYIDREVLDDEEERNRLLAGQSGRQGRGSLFRGLRRDRGGQQTSLADTFDYDDDKKELLYDTEEEGRGISKASSGSFDSSEAEGEKIKYTQSRARKRSLCARICKYTAINVLIAGLFVVIAFGAIKATRDDRVSISEHLDFKSNGTHHFAPTTILVSLDGFRADFLQRGITTVFNSFIREGVSPEYLLPSFPSVTFPNHYTLVTGLYPESHGIVGNSFWDPAQNEDFFYQNSDAMQERWWGQGEPLWVTAERQKVRMATHMWPGSEVPLAEFGASFVDKYNGSEALERKVARILEYIDKPGPDMLNLASVVEDQRPQLVAAYVPNVDSDGHRYGPNSTEIRTTIRAVDNMLGLLLDGLHQRNLTNIVNVVVVSDHGMATTSTDRTIQLEDLVDPDLIEHIDGWPHYGLRPKDPSKVAELYAQLKEQASKREGFDVYTKATMPDRYHFTQNDRIAPLWLMPHTGWAIVTKDEFNVEEAKATGGVYHPRGIHGYDHEHPLMRAIFVARGPAFPHTPGSRVDVFQNIEVYNILCDSVGVEPNKNNGTLRLPFKTSGVHPADLFDEEKQPSDPPFTSSFKGQTSTTGPTATSTSAIATLETGGADVEAVPERPTIIDEHDGSWKDWFKKEADRLKEWFSKTFGIEEDKFVVVEEVQVPGG